MISQMLIQATLETLYMVFVASFLAVVFGLPLGVLLLVSKKGHLLNKPLLHKILDTSINMTRSFPFIILIILLLPLSRFLIGTSIGSSASIIPLAISAIPFVAKLFENSLMEVEHGKIETTLSLGASHLEVIKMMLLESLPSLVNNITITLISLIGYSAMAGALGAGGLGDLAIRIGYQSYRGDVLFYAVVVIIVLVQIIQSTGDYVVKRLRKNKY
ncbi:methionine ABC transporter permease [Helicobacter pylori]|uniref:Binding--dependent transport system inner membrane component family protein n=2 Tax=Helicobacter pylori TaxID=210 RepID=M7S9E6_HELPX|nr:methionine ABC transporter permease [Helicobacter pylori]EJB52975.1 methionine ABC transporter permease protein [Helicobacter pylori Hp H-24]EJC19487.1 binding--dependent transport system inner membrane component family protein [Helicobacter pylori Hp H-24b]EJC20524.1 binding--dependent transport system inner membrane component family protein [Helicobacter pylori Hp H-24c]EJC40356.1 methionine ABC transporter permease protein [Helicobacter pylori Hp M1]EJC42495.1 methionine ABC transporter 